MKSKKIFPRFISVLIALVTFVNLFPALPSSAIDIEDIPPADFVWELDFSKMNDLYDTMGNTSYTLEGKNVTLAESQGKKALSIINKNGLYTINDVENLLDDYNTFYIEADMFFESYPSGTNGGKTSMEYPMYFVSWVTRNNGAESNKYLSIRVDGEGYLCTGTDPINKPTQKSEANHTIKIMHKKWRVSPPLPLFAPGGPPDGVCQPDRAYVNDILIALPLEKLKAPLE